jgi:four helix bundle protein
MARLVDRFVAYQRALEAFRLTAIATKRWAGFHGLVDQAKRTAGSVVHNLAEGNAYPPGSPERRRYQRIAFGCALELESTLDSAVAAELGEPCELEAARSAASEVARILTTIVR